MGVKYVLTGAVTEYGSYAKGKKTMFAAALNARLIDTSTGEVVWADEARSEVSFMVSGVGFGIGVDDERMFDQVMKPCIQKLVASLKASNL